VSDEDRSGQHLNERRAQNYATTRLWNADPNKLGMDGERTLADFFYAEPDLRNRPGGDDRIDLEVLLCLHESDEWFEVDVKTANIPKYLLVNVAKIVPHRLYVLCAPMRDHFECLGYERGSAMMEEPTEAWSGNDAVVHFKSRFRLQPMSTLRESYRGWWRHHGLEPRPARRPTKKERSSNPFFGYCACGAPGLYWTPAAWFCQEHRP
jgi:hypothetical protein